MAIDFFPQGGAPLPPLTAPRAGAPTLPPTGKAEQPADVPTRVKPSPGATGEGGMPARGGDEAHVAPPSLLQIKILELLNAQAEPREDDPAEGEVTATGAPVTAKPAEGAGREEHDGPRNASDPQGGDLVPTMPEAAAPGQADPSADPRASRAP